MTVIAVSPDSASRRKAMSSLAWEGFLEVWEGAVRSSKTVYALCAFALYVIRSPGTRYLLSGRTVKTIELNAILGEFGLLSLIPGADYRKVGESRAVVLSVMQDGRKVRKTINVSGAADIRAYMQIRGNSYDGWFADEINMHDRQFVEEAMRRTAVSPCRRHFWTLNPDNPRHWVYTEYIDRYAQMDAEELRALGGFRLYKFTPEDNPAMTPQMLASLKAQYPEGSYLYRRYILGERCIAEGLVYPKVNASFFRDFDRTKVAIRYCAIDFGTDHPTVMVFGGTFGGNRFDWRLCAEYYDEKSDKTTYDHYVGFLDVCKILGADPSKVIIAIDPAAKVLRLEFIKHGLSVVKAHNDVLPGIDYTRTAIYDGTLSFHSSMTRTLGEFGTYSWDPKASERGEDKPVKLGDDCMDAVRYFAYTHMRPLIGGMKHENHTARHDPSTARTHARGPQADVLDMALPGGAHRDPVRLLHRPPRFRRDTRRRQHDRQQLLRVHQQDPPRLHDGQPPQVRRIGGGRVRPADSRPVREAGQDVRRFAARARHVPLRGRLRAGLPAQGQVRAQFRRSLPPAGVRRLRGGHGEGFRVRMRRLPVQG